MKKLYHDELVKANNDWYNLTFEGKISNMNAVNMT